MNINESVNKTDKTCIYRDKIALIGIESNNELINFKDNFENLELISINQKIEELVSSKADKKLLYSSDNLTDIKYSLKNTGFAFIIINEKFPEINLSLIRLFNEIGIICLVFTEAEKINNQIYTSLSDLASLCVSSENISREQIIGDILGVITLNALINIDIEDIKDIFKEPGTAFICSDTRDFSESTAYESGKSIFENFSKIFNTKIEDYKAAIYVTSDKNISLVDVNIFLEAISKGFKISTEENLLFGATIDDNFKGKFKGTFLLNFK